MNLEILAGAYKLSRVTVSPKQLLLNRKSPRLNRRLFNARQHSYNKKANPETQMNILNLLWHKDREVKKLVTSIRNNGFIDMGSIVVEKVGRGRSYLVIKGGRLTAALRYLLEMKSTLTPQLRISIERIPVTQFTYRRNVEFNKQEVIGELLASIPTARRIRR